MFRARQRPLRTWTLPFGLQRLRTRGCVRGICVENFGAFHTHTLRAHFTTRNLVCEHNHTPRAYAAREFCLFVRARRGVNLGTLLVEIGHDLEPGPEKAAPLGSAAAARR
jgi:hypothetical protein